MKRNRALITAALPLALLAATLMGCSSNGGGGGSGDSNGGTETVDHSVASAITADASGAACMPSGSVSNGVQLDESVGFYTTQTLTSRTPVHVEEAQRSVLKEGRGGPFAAGEEALAYVTIFSGNTGEMVALMPEIKIPNDAAQLEGAEWAYEAVRCAAPGQRTAIAMQVGEALAVSPAEAGFEDHAEDDAFIMVIDFYDELADCETVASLDPAFPKAHLGGDLAEPFIEIPKCMAPPSELQVTVLEEGDGREVVADETIMTNYVGVYWNGGERFDGLWNEAGLAFSTQKGALIEGFTQAMIGQKIGSTVQVVVPSRLGYQDGKTRVFVLKLLGEG